MATNPNDEFDQLLARYQSSVNNNQHIYFDAEEIGMIIDYYLWTGEIEESQKALDSGLRLHPHSSELKIRQAKIFAITGEKEKALQLLAANPTLDDLEILLIQGEILASLHRFDEAEKVFVQALKNEDFNYDDICLDIAYTYIAQESFERGLKYLSMGYKHNPRNIDILFEMAFCYEQIGDWNKAIENYNLILDIESYSEEAWFYLGQVYYAQEQYLKAYKAFDYVTIINDKNAEAWLQKSHALFQLEKYKEALEGYTSYFELTDNKAEALVCMAECYEEMEDFEESISLYQKAIDLDPSNLDAYIGLAYSSLQKGDTDEAIVSAKKAIEIDAAQIEPFTYLAEANLHAGKYEEAINAYQEALKIDKSQADVWVGLGHVYMLTEEIQQAYDSYNQAFSLSHETENIYLFLAIAQYKLGHVDESLVTLNEATLRNAKAISLFFEVCPEAIDEFEKRIKNDN
jgi:tetratricopeptide (TPR) repeat protein